MNNAEATRSLKSKCQTQVGGTALKYDWTEYSYIKIKIFFVFSSVFD